MPGSHGGRDAGGERAQRTTRDCIDPPTGWRNCGRRWAELGLNLCRCGAATRPVGRRVLRNNACFQIRVVGKLNGRASQLSKAQHTARYVFGFRTFLGRANVKVIPRPEAEDNTFHQADTSLCRGFEL